MKKIYAKKFYLGAVLTAFMVLLWGTISYAQVLATGTQDYRNQVVYVCGISNLDNLSEPCTRKEFAQMLVMASSQKDQAASSQTAAAVDVPGSNEYAKYIRIALRNGWMRTRISGGFEPESIVTLNDAAKAAMSMLGYVDSDFPGNVSEGRLAKFTALSLGDGINASVGTAQLTKQEALNIVYNMLKAKGKNSGSIYGTAINLTLGTDGELNATNVLDDTMQGPVLIKNYNELKTMIPFDIDTANCYTVTANSAILDSMNDMITKIEALLGGIAGISLLVAGVGVMNIMLVSVTERTREIGIRKALGARKSTIMTQFVIEALVTSAFGGILGVAMGCGLTGFIGKIVDIESTPTFGAILISFSVSVAIGLIFGYMPANRAAKLNPIDALRSE